ncbi:MAG: (5-formylfuran-3-yl)methyl phosphate synthase [Pirellulaceae bacterium]
MTGLLVSVRDAAEAAAALCGGATLIDIKEPRHGSLGRASVTQWGDVTRQVAGRVPVSVACGELREQSATVPIPPVPDAAYAKCGLAGCSVLSDWQARWKAWIGQLPPPMQPVAVVYADSQRALAPSPAQVCAAARQLGCPALLWDTHTKDGSCLLEHISSAELAASVRQARYQGMLVVLAGSLTIADLPEVMSLAPDYIAVRGAVCEGDRDGVVHQSLVERFVGAMADLRSRPHRSAHACQRSSHAWLPTIRRFA